MQDNVRSPRNAHKAPRDRFAQETQVPMEGWEHGRQATSCQAVWVNTIRLHLLKSVMSKDVEPENPFPN